MPFQILGIPQNLQISNDSLFGKVSVNEAFLLLGSGAVNGSCASPGGGETTLPGKHSSFDGLLFIFEKIKFKNLTRTVSRDSDIATLLHTENSNFAKFSPTAVS